MGDDFSMQPIAPVQADNAKAQQLAGQKIAREQMESEGSLQSFIDEGAFNPGVMAKRFSSLETRHKRSPKEEEAEKAAKKEERIIAIQRIEKAADDVNKRNP